MAINVGEAEIAATVSKREAFVVQAHQSVEETQWLLQLAETSTLILGVVGWVDLMDPQLGKRLVKLKQHKKFKGARHIIQD